MFKFYTKGDDENLEAVVFYNGQKILTAWCFKSNDEFVIEIDDGSGALQVGWVDYAESD
jgi:hypothetical protein